MNKQGRTRRRVIYLVAVMLAVIVMDHMVNIQALGYSDEGESDALEESKEGGGYAVTGQLDDVGYSAVVYNSDNGLPTSDANFVFSASDGYIWVGGYSGVFRYDGIEFERMDASTGMTSAKVFFEDSKHQIWVGTNDNGAVKVDDDETVHYTYKDGLQSSTIRGFAEDLNGRVYIGTTAGVSYVEEGQSLKNIEDERLQNQYIIRMVSDTNGVVYANTKSGDVFAIEDGNVTAYYSAAELGISYISTIYADPKNPGKVFLGTDSNRIYYGTFGETASEMEEISVDPATDIYWITYACGRIFINSDSVVGYLDTSHIFHEVKNLPMDSMLEMVTQDYQGNLWFASSREGVMKVVTNNFLDVTGVSEIDEVVNTTVIFNRNLYVGTDKGLYVLDAFYRPVEDELATYLGDTRIRCMQEIDGDLWVCTFTNNKGLVCYTKDHQIISYTVENGFISDQTRCLAETSDGKILVGTNSGLAVLQNGKVVKTYGEEEGLQNRMILTVTEGDDGSIICGTDGGGIYVIKDDEVTHLSLEDGLTSDVILRVKKDEERNLYWVITSNSIEYWKDGQITEVSHFPYNNNFDIYYGSGDDVWVLSSAGIYCAKASDMISGEEFDYRLYNKTNGMTTLPTGNSFSYLDDNGNLFISGISGVNRVNIDHYFNQDSYVKVDLKYIVCDDQTIYPDEEGNYTIPAGVGRIYIYPAVLDYSMSNPTVKVFFDDVEDDGVTAKQSGLSTLEYTGFKYGQYTLHIQIVNESTGELMQDATFAVEKKPKILELRHVQVTLIVVLVLFVIFLVWRIMNSTIVRRQYDEIRMAKEEAERANSAKSRFLANMSHEIRTPINTIMGMDEMILREDATDVPKNYFLSVINYAMDIRTASDSLLNLINDILDMSKIESGKMSLVEMEYNQKDLIHELCSMIHGRALQKNLKFEIDVDEMLPTRLLGDEAKIKQIVLNLLTNAVKYTEEGKVVLKVSLEAKNGEEFLIRYEVHDTGIGVREEDIDKVFNAYERLDEEKNYGIQGTGLGLDISRQFTELMGGNIWCESVYGEGSEFIFTVTQKVIDRKPIGVYKEEDETLVGRPYVPQFIAPDAEILVVDDNPMNLMVIKNLLKSTKMLVATAESGEECLEKLRYSNFDIVLLDHMMPGLDGVETCRRIRENYPNLPVYALTANAAAGEEYYLENGFDGYLAKPIDSRLLEQVIMQHLPEEVMTIVTEEEDAEELTEIPKSKQWIYEIDSIDVEEGVKNNGSIAVFLSSLQLFWETIDGNERILKKALADEDIMLYKVKVHALKTSCRIIGDLKLSKQCELLEDAANQMDLTYIKENHRAMMEDYLTYKEKLFRIMEEEESEEDQRPEISEEELLDAYDALREVIPMMDYDSVEMILEQLKDYKLPKEEADRVFNLGRMLKSFQWDEMEELMKRGLS